MNKSTKFSGQPIIKQVFSFIDNKIVYRTAVKHNSDRYTKKFATYEHLITMIFTVISGCSSLRKVTSIMLACEGKINHLGLKYFPKRSTLSDANKRRSSEVFADIYYNPRWGAKKIEKLLFNDYPEREVPSFITIHNILKKNGLICPQKKLRRVKPSFPIFDPKQCNEVWSADYKGKFLIGNKKYCHPLTIADSRSRFLFSAKAHYKENFKSVKAEFTRVFRVYGLPQQVHTDNGSPFGSVQAIQQFTRLSYWFIELGILPVFFDPAHPEQNGRHERMHRDLKAACAKPTALNISVLTVPP